MKLVHRSRAAPTAFALALAGLCASTTFAAPAT